ncbi:translational activator of cytochrome c oxidase 1 [Hylaeus anthracinus]|uniref:translational activator of cytochrome c oxidase 1 n=1 Tax=Hylaeus anthracinus TaxID=313031 RepID=UPI0023B9BCBB|nr:translational activator of cytochrome c oxidase 1 [Hylaeus anthracinus]
MNLCEFVCIMKFRLTSLIYNKCKSIVLQDTRNYAGHSKWQNIKHDKQAKDMARSKLFRMLTNKMRATIAETGVSDPIKNTKLAQLINQARGVDMPLATINSTLNKIKNKENFRFEIIPIRTPSKCTLVLHINTDNIFRTKSHINGIIKKFNSKYVDASALQMFECLTIIIASKNCNLDQAVEDAIQINSQDVEEIQDDDKTYFQFKCEFLSSDKSKTQLMSLGYSISSIEDTCIAQTTVELNEDELNSVNKLKEKLILVDGVEKIEDNIEES